MASRVQCSLVSHRGERTTHLLPQPQLKLCFTRPAATGTTLAPPSRSKPQQAAALARDPPLPALPPSGRSPVFDDAPFKSLARARLAPAQAGKRAPAQSHGVHTLNPRGSRSPPTFLRPGRCQPRRVPVTAPVETDNGGWLRARGSAVDCQFGAVGLRVSGGPSAERGGMRRGGSVWRAGGGEDEGARRAVGPFAAASRGNRSQRQTIIRVNLDATTPRAGLSSLLPGQSPTTRQRRNTSAVPANSSRSFRRQ